VELRVPDAATFQAAARVAAGGLRRGIKVDRRRLLDLEDALSKIDLRGMSAPVLVAHTAMAAMAHQPFGDDPEAAAWIAGLAVARGNDLTFSTSHEGALASLGASWSMESLTSWATSQLGCEPVAAPPSPVRAVLASARTGHPRERLNALDLLASAGAEYLVSTGVEVTDLALGERFPRSPAQSYAHDRRAAEACDLLLAFLHPPSIGVGMVIEMALRQYPVAVFVAEPGEPMPPLPAGLHTYAELIVTGDPQELAAGLQAVLGRRGGELVEHSERRLARPRRWAGLEGRQAPRWALPRWLPVRRASELLSDPDPRIVE
jgi:hypothetical protein